MSLEQEIDAILERLQPHQVWDLTGQGLVYMKGEGEMLTLIATFNTMDAAKVHGVVKGAALKRGWIVMDESPRVIQSQDEQMEFSLDLKRQQIAQMVCPGEDCDLPIAAYDFQNAHWRFLGDKVVEQDGEELAYEDWGVEASCPVCSNTILMPPRDFELVVGTDALETFRGQQRTYEVLHPSSITEIVDSQPDHGLVILGTICPVSGERLPIHLRGRVAASFNNEEEEEE